MFKVQFSRVSASPKVASGLGNLMVAWSQLEFQVQLILWDVSELDSRIGRIMTHRAGMEKWMELATHIVNFRYSDKSASDDWDKVVQAVRLAQTNRNALTHALWSHKVAPGTMRIGKTVNKGRKKTKTIGVEMLNISAKDINDVIELTYEAIAAVICWGLEYIHGPVGQQSPTLPPLT